MPHNLREDFIRCLDNLDSARSFAKAVHQNRLFNAALKLFRHEQGMPILYEQASRFDAAGVFAGGDWAYPDQLDAGLVRATLLGKGIDPALEALSQLRLLAIAKGEASSDRIDSNGAREYLEDILARNLDLLFPTATEETREQTAASASGVQRLFGFIAERLGTGGILKALVQESDRILAQRPIIIDRVQAMLRTAGKALSLDDAAPDDPVAAQAQWLIGALTGPSVLAQRNQEPTAYREALEALDDAALAKEAEQFGQAMRLTGLVAPTHATLLQHILAHKPEHLPAALALETVGRASLEQHEYLTSQMIRYVVQPETARCIYGLSRMLELGILFFRPVPPGLLRILVQQILPEVEAQLQQASGLKNPPPGRVLLLAGTLSVIGQPRGMDQGHNPTCQAARAISLWAQNDVGYLLELITRAARDGDLVMHFEGESIRSSQLSFGLAQTLHTELDPVSLILTPHLDRAYMEMSRRTIGRGADGHKWVNPELHGWWVYRSFAALINATSGAVHEFERFMREFYAAYHPEYNGGRELVYAQPCGVAVTNYRAEFVGWHAVSIQRVAKAPQGEWRLYFFNPNRDRGQNWGNGVVTTTCDHGEYEGESSLPFAQFASRLYVYHYKRRELGDPAAVPAATVAQIQQAVRESWAANLPWT